MTTSAYLSLVNLALTLLVLTAAAHDIRTRRISDWLVGMGLVSALVAQDMAIGVGAGCLVRLDGAVVGTGLCFGSSMLGGMGAGDMKLMGAIDASIGLFGALHVALASFLAGGILTLAMVLLRWEVRRSTAGVSALLLSIPFGSKAAHAEGQGPRHGGTIQLPYVVAFAADALLVKWGAMQPREGTLARARVLQEQLTTTGQIRSVNNVSGTYQIPRHPRTAQQRSTQGE